MTFDDDDARPDREVPAKKVAEERWRKTEPWRVRARRRRRLKVSAITVVVGAAALTIALTSSSPTIPPRDVAGVAASGSGYEVLFYGCHGERLQDLALYAGAPPSSGAVFSSGSIWYVQAQGAGLEGHVSLPIGSTPGGFQVIVPYHGLPASPAVGYFTLAVKTNDQLLHIDFDASLVAGGQVVTDTGRYLLATYQQDEAAACR
jgi:hypothetical protein